MLQNVFRRKKTSYRNLLENTSLLSPINGIITARAIMIMEICIMAILLLVVEQIVPVKLLINISENYFSKIKKGSQLKLSLMFLKEKKVFNGKISLIYPTINAATRTFPVELVLNKKI